MSRFYVPDLIGIEWATSHLPLVSKIVAAKYSGESFSSRGGKHRSSVSWIESRMADVETTEAWPYLPPAGPGLLAQERVETVASARGEKER